MKISREIKAAVLVISGVILFIFLFNYLKGQDLFSDQVDFYTEFEYNALTMSSPVTVKGNVVGKVENIKYDFSSGMTRVEFSVDPRLSFSKSSTIKLYETGLMGGNGLAIIDSYQGEKATKGDYIKSEVEPGLVSALSKNFSGLSTNLDKTLRSADTLMISLNGLVTDDSDAGLKATLAELNATLKSFKNLSTSIQGVVKQNDQTIKNTLENFNKVTEDLKVLSNDLKTVQLSETIQKFDKTLSNINNLMDNFNKGEGSLGKLLNDDKLYNNLEAASKEMELLLLDIKLHPARYRRILSKKEIPYEAPTEEQLQKN